MSSEVEKIRMSTSPLAEPQENITQLGAKEVPDVLCEGWLQKEGRDFKNWKTRWCVLGARYGLLYYYKTADDKQPQGFIPLAGCSLKVNDKKKKLCFQISHPDRREFFLVAQDNKDLFRWIQSVQTVIDKEKNDRFNYIKTWQESLGHVATTLEWNELIKLVNQQLQSNISIESENLFHYLLVTLCNDENQPLNLITFTQLTSYIDLFGPILNVVKFREIHKWYHGFLEEGSVQKKLRAKEPGTFILWLRGYPGELTLSVNGEAIKHFAIKMEPVTKQFYFNIYNHGDKTFPSIEDLVRSDNKKRFKKFVLSPFIMFFREFDYQRDQYEALQKKKEDDNTTPENKNKESDEKKEEAQTEKCEKPQEPEKEAEKDNNKSPVTNNNNNNNVKIGGKAGTVKQSNNSNNSNNNNNTAKRRAVTTINNNTNNFVLRWSWKDQYFSSTSSTQSSSSPPSVSSPSSSSLFSSSTFHILTGDIGNVVTFHQLLQLLQANEIPDVDLTTIQWRYSIGFNNPNNNPNNNKTESFEFCLLKQGESLHLALYPEIDLLFDRDTTGSGSLYALEPDGEGPSELDQDDVKNSEGEQERLTLARIYTHRSLLDLPLNSDTASLNSISHLVKFK